MAVISSGKTTITTSIRRMTTMTMTTMTTATTILMLVVVFASAVSVAVAASPSPPPLNCDKVAASDALRDYGSIVASSMPTQGPICGSNSCCAQVENKIRQSVRKNVDGFYKHSVGQVSSLLEVRSRRLEELFREMMAKSKKELHLMFERTYGMIYLQNSVVFTDFFAELEKYYNHGGISLTETIDRFFTILYQRMFKVINAQYDFDDEYLTCVAKDIGDVMPFGDIPRKLTTLLRRAFVATRTFHRALSKGALVAERMLKWSGTERECAHEVAKMQYCDTCKGISGPGACFAYCTDTLKSCFAPVAELSEKWDVFIDGLDKISDKLLSPFNIEMVVEPINVKISEAIMNFQEIGADVSRTVFHMCGQPKLKGDRRRRRRQASRRTDDQQQQQRSKEVKFQPLRFNNNNNSNNNKGKNRKKLKKNNDYDMHSPMEKRIMEVKQKIKETRNFWNHLPYQFCNNVSTAAPSERTCWNGHSSDEYVPSSTPEPSLNKNKNQLVLEQIYTLNVLISKLESAYLGQDDELSDDDDDEGFAQSGSGSGDDDFDEDVDVNTSPITPTVTSTIGTTARTNVAPTSTARTSISTSAGTASTTSSTSTTTDSNEVEDVKEYDVPQVVKAASAADVTRAVAYYVLPVVMVWFGGAVVEIL